MLTDDKTLGFIAVLLLISGCIPAYFHSMTYAASLWMTGFGIMNVHVYIVSREKS